jgi:hypothetical protein
MMAPATGANEQAQTMTENDDEKGLWLADLESDL